MAESRTLDLDAGRAAVSKSVEEEVDQYIAFLNGAFAMPANTYDWQGRLSRSALRFDVAPASTRRPTPSPAVFSAPKRRHKKENAMRRKLIAAACAAAMITVLGSSAQAQGVAQTLSLMKVDPATLATGYRTSKVVGTVIVNDTDEKVATIDDLIVTKDGKVPYAVLSIGGFLGVGSRNVVVLASDLQVRDDRMVLPGATRESLRDLPEYSYSK
jgi:hypothetical protein